MGLYGSPDLSQKKTKSEKERIPKFKKILLGAFIIINMLLIFIGGINKLNVLGTLAFDCIIIFIYSIVSIVYNAIKKNKFKKYILIMVLTVIGFLMLSVAMAGYQENTVIETSSKEDRLKYTSLAKTYDYKDIERNPDEYKGDIAVFQGRVMQVSELGTNQVHYRVGLEDSEGTWSHILYVTYVRGEGEPRILEDDTIKIYGDLNGVITYESVMAGNITIPAIIARYIDIIE